MASGHSKHVFKILPTSAFQDWSSSGTFKGAGIDIKDGYIHLSSAAQGLETYNKYFAGQSGLVVAEVDLGKVKDEVRWEPSRGGDLFAHVYGAIPIEAVSRHWEEVNEQLFGELVDGSK